MGSQKHHLNCVYVTVKLRGIPSKNLHDIRADLIYKSDLQDEIRFYRQVCGKITFFFFFFFF